MKIALINTIKPEAGSGDGITDYTYRLYERLKKHNRVDLVYGLRESRRNDVSGNIIIHSLFKSKIRGLAGMDYDIIHITNQELGFAAKILKKAGTKAKIVISVHDLMRLDEHEKRDFHKGVLQSTFNYMVSSSMHDGIRYSDMIVFTASTVQRDSMKRFKIKRWCTTLLGPKEHFRRSRIPPKRHGEHVNIGWVGALAFRKNAIFILKTALLVKDDDRYRFAVWGDGAERQNLINFKNENSLDKVDFKGFAPENGLMRIYDSFDIFFYPSLEEGSSLPILDAQARGLPVIVHRDNHMDIEVTKYCFAAKNPKEAVKLIKKLSEMGYDAKLRKRATAYARSFSWDRVAKGTFDAYKSLLKYE
ncbi:MAG: glycosyltransferase family 4 protein [Candidatus Micrarchaeota archaeon]|nr:glycosyltransferase family 4 protein [Candidatus Micrarchaeota archaeon]